MRFIFSVLSALCAFSLGLETTLAQSFTSSNLPIVIIQTDINPATGQPFEIPDDPKIPASMKIIFGGEGVRNNVSEANDPLKLIYNGRIAIELRGSTSQELPKKPYGLTTVLADNVSNNNVSLFGFPKENDWVLNSLAFDASLIRDAFSYDVMSATGNYASRGRYCEVLVNGDYKGLYVFMEKIKIEGARVDIAKIEKTDISGRAVTGGYITKADKTTGGDPVAWSMEGYNGGTDFIHERPKPADVTAQQNAYIKQVFTSLAEKASNSAVVSGYPTVIDVPTFVDFMLMNELASNVDAYQYSTFFHKDRGGKLRAGPVWDFNLTFGNDLRIWGFDRSFTNVWQFDNGDNTGPRFWKQLYLEPEFRRTMNRRWRTLHGSGGPFSEQKLFQRIDSLVQHISEAIPREHARWNTVPNHATEISTMKTWISQRLTWVNTQFQNESPGVAAVVPNLVISRIHYNPKVVGTIKSDAMEFIEITNRGETTADLTGIYFSGTGLGFQFPAGKSLAAKEKVYVASDSLIFVQQYGFSPIGFFSRNLSNTSQLLSLSDAMGSPINRVRYSDQAPWPTDADGLGAFLELVDINADNSKPENWRATNGIATAAEPKGLVSNEDQITVYPNPGRGLITVSVPNAQAKSITVYDVLGRLVQQKSGFRTMETSFTMNQLPAGMYFVRVEFSGSTVPQIRKFFLLP